MKYYGSWYSPFSVTSFDRYEAKMSQVTETWKAHQMNVNVERNLFAKFHKDGGEECFSLKSNSTEFVVESKP